MTFLKNDITVDFDMQTGDFEQKALEIFHYQAVHNIVYRKFIAGLGINVKNISSLQDIPFLPVSFFKTHKVICNDLPAEKIFLSSATTGSVQSKHYVPDTALYTESYSKGFHHFYGAISDYCILALLPSYLEREGSSLIEMVAGLIRASGHPESGFYLHNVDELAQKLLSLDRQRQRVLLLGVSYALLDLVEQYSMKLRNVIVMETGGMKGKRKEMVREELHAILCDRLGVELIHSEYGMTELLSQAYSKGNGLFQCPPWMRVMIRDINDPFSLLGFGKTGGINVIDLANVHSCSFIATQDLGKLHQNNSFEVLGRFDNSDIRGCNLLVD